MQNNVREIPILTRRILIVLLGILCPLPKAMNKKIPIASAYTASKMRIIFMTVFNKFISTDFKLGFAQRFRLAAIQVVCANVAWPLF